MKLTRNGGALHVPCPPPSIWMKAVVGKTYLNHLVRNHVLTPSKVTGLLQTLCSCLWVPR